MSPTSTILLFARDPGGANTVIPLIEPLSTDFQVLLYGKDMALAKYRDAGFEGLDIMQKLPDVTPSQVRKFLENIKPDYILTGTSGDDFTEKFLWREAAMLGIPSAAILDQWVNYGVRFSPYGVSEISAYRENPVHDYQPDKIMVMDDEARNAMLEIGFDPARILVTGQPHFQWMREHAKNIQNIDAIQSLLNIPKKNAIITFVSEPLSELCEQSAGGVFLGYTEKTIFKALWDTLVPLVEETARPVSLVIKLHPRENPLNYESELKRLQHSGIQVILNQNVPPAELIAISDLVCGMSSMLLIEAFILDKPVCSIQIGLNQEDPFVLSRQGYIEAVTNPEALPGAIRHGLGEISAHAGKFPFIENPVERIVQYWHDMYRSSLKACP